MKTLITTIAVSVLLLSCSMKSDSLFPLNLSVKEGKGIIKTNQFEMNIDEIKVAQSISAEVVKSDTEKVVITAPCIWLAHVALGVPREYIPEEGVVGVAVHAPGVVLLCPEVHLVEL